MKSCATVKTGFAAAKLVPQQKAELCRTRVGDETVAGAFGR